MKKGSHKAVSTMVAALLLGLSGPALAHTEVEVETFEATISQAKSRMMADPASALNLARKAKTMVKGDHKSKEMGELTARWLEGEALMRLNRGEEAAGLIESALSQASGSYTDRKIYADLLRSAASARARAGKFKEALPYFQLASERYEALGDDRSRAIVLQNIGSLYSKANDFEKVLEYYGEAASVFSDDGPLSLSAHNNVGNALKGLERYEEAEQEFAAALVIAKKMSSPVLEARILTNLASTQSLRGAHLEAEETAVRALGLADAHAADWKPFIYGVLAQTHLGLGNLDKAEEFIGRTFADRPLDATNVLFRDFHEVAVEIYSQRRNEELAALHSQASDRIDREAKEVRL